MRFNPALRATSIFSMLVCCTLFLSCGGGHISASAPQLKQIVVAPTNPQIAQGDTVQLAATGIFDDGSQGALAGSPTWQSSNSSVATVNAQGNVTGTGQGAAQISADYQGVTGNTSVNVGAPVLVSITVSATQSSLPVGESEQLTATGNFSDGSSQNLTQSASWSSSQSSIASVSPVGIALATGVGTATFSASSGAVTGSVKLSIIPPAVTGLTLTPPALPLSLGVNGTLQAMATLSNGTTQNVSALAAWASNQTTIATVNAQGAVTSLAQGSATISAAYQGASANAAVSVGPPTLVSIAVTLSQTSLPVGESGQATATGKFTDGSTQNLTQSVTWSSSASVASVNAAGKVAATAVGTATVTATLGSVSGTENLTVIAPAVTAINLGASTLSMPLGASQALQLVGTMSNGTTQNITASATWSSAQPGIVKVSPQGNLTAVGRGTAQISAAYQSANQALTSSVTVSVGPPALLSITVSPNPSSLPLGESEQLTATGNYTDGSVQKLTQSVRWNASAAAAANVASVNAGGSVLASAIGTTTISATLGLVTGVASITVTPPVPVAVNIAPATLSLVLGSSTQLHAVVTMSDGTVQDMSATAEWSSAQPNIATVSGGVITTVQVGSTTITAQINNLTGSANLIVMPLFLVNYFSHVNAKASGIDATIRVTNPSMNPGSATAGSMCAMVYVFDQKQELNECCGCTIPDSGLLTLSLANDLTANTLTGRLPRAGQIKIVPSDPTQNPQCNPTSLSPSGQLAAWGTNSQPAGGGTYQVTENAFDVRPLTNTETTYLVNECSYARQLGSGAGVCTCGGSE